MCENLVYEIKKVHDGWITHVRGRQEHSHFRTKAGCSKLVSMLRQNKLPAQPYFIEAARRILTNEEFDSLIYRPKQVYVNVPKVKKRC